MMDKIIVETEHQIAAEPHHMGRLTNAHLSVSETICQSMARAAEDLDISGIAVFTETGTTARLLSKYRPCAPIYALSPIEPAINRMSLLWGVTPVKCPRSKTTDEMVEVAETLLEKSGYVKDSQVLGIVAGTRTRSGSTNFLRLHYVGDRDHAETRGKTVKQGKTARSKTQVGSRLKTPAAEPVTHGDSVLSAAQPARPRRRGR
jgi:pyruvate kinase